MACYRLSGAATKDIVAIYKFGIKHFGLNPAKLYLKKLDLFLEELSMRRELARNASAFAHNLFYYRYKAHVIFYQFTDEKDILVIRILGKRMDFIKHL